MKKVVKKFIALVLFMFIASCVVLFNKNEKATPIPLSDFDEFKQIDFDKITEVEVIYYREGGDTHEVYTEKTDIKKIYDDVYVMLITFKNKKHFFWK